MDHASEHDDVVVLSVEDGVATITMNRPSRRNALNTAMITELGQAIASSEGSDEIGAIVITGAGGAFCAGGDVLDFDAQGGEGKGASSVDQALVEEQRRQQRDTVGRLYRCRKPVVAAIPGAAAGAGLGLALAADLRVASEDALMVTAFAAVGLSGDYGVAWLLQRLVGPGRARELLFLNRRLGADESLGLGLVSEVTAREHLASRAHELAAELARGPRLALAHMKSNLVEGLALDLEAAMDAEVPRHKECGLTADHLGAIAAFAEKRKPTFGN